MFYRLGGGTQAPNRQQDFVYADYIGGATDWLPVSKGDNIAVNIARASLEFQSVADSKITSTPTAPECVVMLEQKVIGGANPIIFPIDQWQNLLVATSRDVHRQGWVRLRIVNINNQDGTGVSMSLEISRTGVTGTVT